MKILAPSQIRALDEYTIKNEPVSSIDLMERAAIRIANYLTENYSQKCVYVICGTGNNGGDGLAVARLLIENQVKTLALLVEVSDTLSVDAQKNKEQLCKLEEKKGKFYLTCIQSMDSIPNIAADAIIVDALFGTGINRPLEGLAKKVVDYINSLPNTVIAIDLPSGLPGDTSVKKLESVIKADVTLSFQVPKLNLLLPDAFTYVGHFELLDIGLLEQGILQAETKYFYVDKTLAASYLKQRKKFDHKGHFGHGILIAGSYGKMGAAILSAKACLKSGVGLLTVHIPHWGYSIMQTAVPEAMTSIDRSDMYFTEYPDLKPFNAVAVGPGLNTKQNSVKALTQLLIEHTDKPVVIDADGINILATHTELLKLLTANSILTPHPGEFKRLVGEWNNDYEKLEKLQAFCHDYNTIVVLKGAHTVTCLPSGECFFNSTGNAGMATAGSGDVLTGIILALLAQNYLASHAAVLGVYLHGMAGDYALECQSEESLIASDIISHLAIAFKQLRSNK